MEQAETTGGQGTNRTAGIMGRVRNSANAQLSTQKDRATEGLGSVAQAVRQSTQQLREQQHDTIAQYVEQAADQLEKLSTRLKEKNVNELLDDAQRFARQRPALFIGSAFAIGLVGSRFFKSSAERSRSGFDEGTARSRYAAADLGTGYGSTDVGGTGYVGAGTGYAGTNVGGTGYGGTTGGTRFDETNNPATRPGGREIG